MKCEIHWKIKILFQLRRLEKLKNFILQILNWNQVEMEFVVLWGAMSAFSEIFLFLKYENFR